MCKKSTIHFLFIYICKLLQYAYAYSDPSSRMESELNEKWNHMTKTDNLYLKIDKEVSMQRDLQRDRMALCRKMMNAYWEITYVLCSVIYINVHKKCKCSKAV